jgi:hypothetical protein
MSDTSGPLGLPKNNISDKLFERRDKIAWNILRNTKSKLINGRLICGEYEILLYFMNSKWIEVRVEKKEEEILIIKDTGNIAKIIKHIRIAIS